MCVARTAPRASAIASWATTSAGKNIDVRGKHVLHLSPERCFWRQWHAEANYVSGDIKKSPVANTVVDVTCIPFPDEHFDYLFCNHILEHVVNDRQGMRECHAC